jgi:hypothetical protein
VKLEVENRLLFATAHVEHGGKAIEIDHILIDTGSGGTVLAAGKLINVGIFPKPEDRLRRIAGVGGAEYVFEKTIDRLVVGDLVLNRFTVEVGALDYGFAINGIIGLDFLIATGAVIDLGSLILKSGAAYKGA